MTTQEVDLLKEVCYMKFTNSYKVTLNHVSLSSLGKVFDYWMKNLNYELLICGFEKGEKQGQPHFQVYIQNTDIDDYEKLRVMLCADLYQTGVIDEKMTCVAFPIDDPSPERTHHLVEYSQKDGHYIKHLARHGLVECRWSNVIGKWRDEVFYSRIFDYFRENSNNFPTDIHHVKTWG